jgi:hypothetical protein
MARNRSLTKERVRILIIDFLLIRRNLHSRKRDYKDYSVATNKSDFFLFTRSYNRLYKVFLTKLKAAIPIGAARKTRFFLLACLASS